MICKSREEKRTILLRKRGGGGSFLVAVSLEVVCRQATHLLVQGTEIHCWGGRKQQQMELIVEDLITGVDDVRPHGNRLNYYINRIFGRQLQRVR